MYGLRRGGVPDPKVAREIDKTRICRPKLGPCDEGGGEKMNVDPADAAPVQLARAHELHNLGMWNRRCPGEFFVTGKERGPPAAIPDEKLAEHEVVSQDLAPIEQHIEHRHEWRLAGERPDPDGRIDENHQPTRFLAARLPCGGPPPRG